MFSFDSTFLIVAILYVVVAVVAVVLVILLARLTLAATKTLNTVTEERRLRIALLIAERGDDIDM